MRRSWGRSRWLVVVGLGLMGCSLDGLLKSDALPSGVTDPAITQTPAGAVAAYHGTLAQFRNAFGAHSNNGLGGAGGSAVAIAALLTDELQDLPDLNKVVDARTLPEGESSPSDATYSRLQKVRGQASQAIGLLSRYLPEQPALAGHIYAIEAYAEVLLAELFCSGIPLSTLDFDGDYTVQPGSTTGEVFTHAVALFDTALALAQAGDSTRIVDLARVGRARALLALGQYTEAAVAVASVPDDYRYALSFTALADTMANAPNFARLSFDLRWDFSVADGEGGNGLAYRSSGDPRTPTSNVGTAAKPVWHPAQYTTDGASPIVLASGVEARLIEAEAALQAGSPTWLTTLNALRTDGTFMVDTQVVSVDNTVTPPDTTFAYDTLWHAGSGGVAGLAPLDDPGTAAARVDLVFHERAFWLFLTGHRQGDLRRLIRQYGRLQDQVYPIGPDYGTDVTVPVPASEQISNPRFTGCASREA